MLLFDFGIIEGLVFLVLLMCMFFLFFQGASWSLIGFGAAAGARNGLTNIAPLADVTQYVVEATNYAKFARPGFVFLQETISATIANLVQSDWRKDTDRNYMRHCLGRCQTDFFKEESLLRCLYPINSNERLEFRADNGNNAQIEAGYFCIGKPTELVTRPPMKNIRYIYATMTGTLTANLPWTAGGAVTWSHTFDPQRRYKIVGMGAHSATLYAARIVFPDSNYRPGVPGSDTVNDMGMLYGDFGDFIGHTPPTFEFSASAADTAEYVTLAIM